MRSSFQFRIRWLMLAVAVLALLLAWLSPVLVVSVFGLALVLVVPMILASPGRRIRAVAWVVSLYPVMVPICLYMTWLVAWCVLGHRPRPSLDDPKYIGPLVDVPYVMTCLSMMSWPISGGIGLFLATVQTGPRSRINPLLIMVATWFSVLYVLSWDPAGVGVWFMD
jgi:hypothetical protein